MLWATNAAIQALGEEALVSFDTLIASTNGSVKVDDDQIMIMDPGWYEVSLRGVFVNSSTSIVQVGVRLIANDQPVPGSEMTWKVQASGSTPVFVSMPVHVLPASSGVATLGWQVTDQATLDDVMLSVERKI